MAIIGIERLVYGVEDLAESTRFFRDFGLKELHADVASSRFGLVNGAEVEIHPLGSPALPQTTGVVGQGVQEVVWGVDRPEALAALCDRLEAVVPLSREGDLVRFGTPFGVPMALRLWVPRPLTAAPDAANAPGLVGRLNRPRRWRLQATPRLITHVVFAVPNYDEVYRFMVDVLNFRLTDRQTGFGNYLRADGTTNHHNILFLNADAPFPGVDGKLRFHHANFALEDVDEIMIAVNAMVRKGWAPSDQGLGRHRVDSALFYYFPCPAGGEAEFGADADAVDDNWVPREWLNPLFAYAHFVHNLPPFLMREPDWNFRYMTGIEPAAGHH
ncbi:VOC family protein [Sphingomonas naphthae]|uniref:VOC family protein n=1 Tax=Sphingomonas naphthae TaxID=1813468 RepID=A0ABY7TQ95_9SPHN|nr:VOC family protein [Sphingomonas naphthae]WCT75120.1 VOC family protein [Sphingomonas naphthae]